MKHGIHTIFILAEPTDPFSKVTEELLEVLRERYAEGLTTSRETLKTTPIPAADEDFQMSYGVLKAPTDPSQGWKKLSVEEDDTLSVKGLKNNTVIAFAFLSPGEAASTDFDVEFPDIDDDE